MIYPLTLLSLQIVDVKNSYCFFIRETVVRVTGGMKVKADRDEVSIALYSCLLKVKVKSYTLDEMTLVS